MAVKFNKLSYGCEGKDVRECKKLLRKLGSGVKLNDKFDIGMVSAVRAFQKNNGLLVTGIIDYKTFKKLGSMTTKAKK